MEEIEQAREQRSFMICGESGKKVAIDSLSPDLHSLSSNRIDQIDIDELVSVKNLGQGAFSTVYLSKYKQKFVAVKKYSVVAGSDLQQEITRELLLTASLSGPHIVQMVGFVLEGGRIQGLVMEAMDCGWDRIVYDNSYPLTWQQRLEVLGDIADGMLTIHEAGITHRDLKSANVLIQINRGGGGAKGREFHLVAKVTDFNVSCVVMDAEQMSEWPPYFIAPEVMAKKPCSFLVDVYSFAVLCFETLSRKLLFSELVQHRFDEAKVREAVLSGERPELVDHYPLENPPDQFMRLFTELVDACWQQQPTHRPQFPAIIKRLKRLKTISQEFSNSNVFSEEQVDRWVGLLTSSALRVAEEGKEGKEGKEEGKEEEEEKGKEEDQ
eukprot:CAMPEP_0201540484 /NCGR_PEP_ID=MMETSP0161_2-20130828/70967_1 /ASSEMBLY_ACC=CAM_ASM_000251 /TAXON_ID=180227 /ORGANISM="Neoparamoeba aestuarina, Strain SoJaBio B1-5/56/2" /LENGTH=381 /DNA_ID=CAMNT_0047947955 /DNA_START=1196 /DNA_END=2341 /DNA_ORIENTATION=-